MAEEQLRSALAEAYGDRVPEVDPAEAMLQAVSWKFAEVVALRAQVAALGERDMVWGKTRVKTGGDDYGTTKEAKPSVWWVMLRTAEDQLVRFAAAARSAGCDERRVKLSESYGLQIAGVLQRVLASLFTALERALGSHEAALAVLREAWADAVAEIVPRELRAIAGGEAGAA